jgi:hypothetical protein
MTQHGYFQLYISSALILNSQAVNMDQTWLPFLALLSQIAALNVTMVPETIYNGLNPLESGFYSFIACGNSEYIATLNLDFSGSRENVREPILEPVNLPHDETLERTGYSYAAWHWSTTSSFNCVEVITRLRNSQGLDFSSVRISVVIIDIPAGRIRVDEGQYFDVVLLQDSLALTTPHPTPTLQSPGMISTNPAMTDTSITSTNPATSSMTDSSTHSSIELEPSSSPTAPVAVEKSQGNVPAIATGSVIGTMAVAIIVIIVAVLVVVAIKSRSCQQRRINISRGNGETGAHPTPLALGPQTSP